jgi:aminoglycoside phosphotransferase (APT) family kinase protein
MAEKVDTDFRSLRVTPNVFDSDLVEQDDAEQFLTALGLPDQGRLLRVASYSNAVWVGRTVVLRVAPPERPWAFTYEQDVLLRLPPSVPHATVECSGMLNGRAWIVLRRLPGRELGRAWPGLTVRQRRALILRLGHIVHAMHALGLPTDWQRPDLRPEVLSVRRSALDVAAPYQQPPERISALVAAARSQSGVDAGVVDACLELVTERLPLFAGDQRVLVHTDLHWENLLVERTNVTGVLDFEMARPGAPDLELDVLLRFCHWPHLPVAADYEHLLQPADFRAIPEWLALAYPELFAAPHLCERMEVYAVLHDLRQCIQFPEIPGQVRPPWSPWNRLRATLSGASYLREWL